MGREAVSEDGRINPRNHSKEHREDRRDQRQFQSRRQAFENHIRDRLGPSV